MANRTRTQLSSDSLSLFPDNTSQLISPQDLRDWITNGIDSFVTQKDASALQNVIYEADSTSIAAGSTTNLALADGNFVHINGAGTTINSFGNLQAGTRFVLVFDGVYILTYNATSLIIPGAANKTTAVGDACLILSEGSGNWRIVGYFPISGSGGGGITALTGDVTASGTGSVTATIANSAVDIPMLSATGTPSSTTFLRGDNQWATPSGASPTGYYAMYQSLVTQTAASSNTGYAMIFGTMDLSNQVTVANNGSGNPTRITFANAGVYNLQFSSQFQNTDNAGHDVTIWIRLNGTDVPGSSGFVQVPARKNTGAGNEGHIITGWNYLLDVAAGEYYEIVWSTSDHTNITMQYYPGSTPPPSTASTIFTVTQQAGIMAGTGITGMVGNSGATQTGATQTFASSEMTIASSSNTHTFTIPDASASTKGLVTTSAQTLSGIKTFANGVSGGEIKFAEPSGTGTSTVSIKAQSMASDYSLTLPASPGTAGDFLQYGTGGNLAWANPNTYGFFRSFRIGTQGTGVNGNTVTISNYVEIPAGAFSAGDMATILVQFYKTGGVARVFNSQILINTVNSVSGATVLATLQNGASALYSVGIRELSVFSTGGSGQSIVKNTTTPISDFNTYGVFATNAASLLTIDWSVTQYLMHTLAQSGGPTPGEIGYSAGLSITSR